MKCFEFYKPVYVVYEAGELKRIGELSTGILPGRINSTIEDIARVFELAL